jgi:DNA (cytosine-5)-methyltransferase 1
MRMLDLFSGVGGFHKGFEQARYQFDWVGFSEIDKYASAVYKHRFPKSEELGDITTIRPRRDLPNNIDIICGGFPCQAFSVAVKRLGFDDTRGTLFFEIARILRHYRDVGNPISCFLLENVKGLLSHDNGRTFATIYRVLDNLGYTIEFQLLNTRWWLPQNRERIYIVGYIGNRGGRSVFPIGEDGGTYNINQAGTKSKTKFYTSITTREGSRKENNYIITEPQLKQIGTIGNDSESSRVYDANGISRTIKDGGGMGAKTGLYRIPEATKKGYAEAEVGDSINLSVPNSKTRRSRVGKGEAQTLDTGMQQYTIQPKKIEIIGNLKGEGGHECHNVHSTEGIAPTVRHNHGKTTMVKEKTNIRRLTPVECERLQGFPDMFTSKGIMNGKIVDMSDTQRYKQMGNAVTVKVIEVIADKMKVLFNE